MGVSRDIKSGMRQGVGFLLVVLLGTGLTFLAAQEIRTFTAGQVVKAGEINANFAALKASLDNASLLRPPVGSIIAWHNGIAGTPALPDGWMRCDGGVVSDSASPLNGQTLPDLNGTGRFLRGGSAAGTLQADEFRSHNHGNGAYQYLLRSTCNSTAQFNDVSCGEPDILSSAPILPAGGSETRPVNMSVVWIMRVK